MEVVIVPYCYCMLPKIVLFAFMFRVWLLCAVGPLSLTMRTTWRAFWRCRQRRKPICSTMLNPVEDCMCVHVCECESGPTAESGKPVLLGSSTVLSNYLVLMETDQLKSDWTASRWWLMEYFSINLCLSFSSLKHKPFFHLFVCLLWRCQVLFLYIFAVFPVFINSDGKTGSE